MIRKHRRFFKGMLSMEGIIFRTRRFLSQRQKVQYGIYALCFIILASTLFIYRSKIVFRAEDINTGTAQVANLTNNGTSIGLYEKFELTFGINRLNAPNGTVVNNLNAEIEAGTINPYWPYDKNPAVNQYWANNHPEWSIDTDYTAGSNHVQHNGVIYASIKSTPINASIEPGGTGNWQEYWLANPPDPIPAGKGISIDGLFSNDNWATVKTIPGFYYQEYARRQVGTGTDWNNESMIPNGQPQWKIRFAPTDEGNWEYKIRATDSTGTTTYSGSSPMKFSAISSSSHGFVRVSPTDPRYFELSDGTTLMGPSVNEPMMQTTFEADTVLQKYGDNDVKIIRYMMIDVAWQNPFGGSDNISFDPKVPGQNGGGPIWNYRLKLAGIGGKKPGDKFAAVIAPKNPADLIASPGKLEQSVSFVGDGKKLYRFSGWIKNENVVGADGTGAIPFLSSVSGTPISGTNDWTEFKVDFTPLTDKNITSVGINNTATSGNVYFDDGSLKSSDDGGITWSGELLRKGDMDLNHYVDLQEASKVDYIADLAQKNGVYLYNTIGNNSDRTMGSTYDDGTVGPFNINNTYSYGRATHTSAWLWKTWWRYATARWGANTSVFAWELTGEGDPFNGNLHGLTNIFADYIHSFSANKHLASTSFWTWVPMFFWKNSSADFMDVHEYMGPNGTHGPKLYAWTSTLGLPPNGSLPNVLSDSRGSTLEFDPAEKHSGTRSLKFTTKPGTESISAMFPQYYMGIDPSHTYTLRYWGKTKDLGRMIVTDNTSANIAWSETENLNDYISGINVGTVNLGTHDWEKIETKIRPPIGNIGIFGPIDNGDTVTIGKDPLTQDIYEFRTSGDAQDGHIQVNVTTNTKDGAIAAFQTAVNNHTGKRKIDSFWTGYLVITGNPKSANLTFTTNEDVHGQNFELTVSGKNIRAYNTNTINLSFSVTRKIDSNGTFWLDDVELIDNATGENLFVDGGFEGDRIDYDTVLMIQKQGKLYSSYANRLNKPVLWAENGITGPNIYGSSYKGLGYTGENQQLVDDNDMIYMRKMIWPHLGPDNPNMLYWWTQNLNAKNKWSLFKSFKNFLVGIPLSNGRYKDARTVSSSPNLRAIGQKEVIDGKASRAVLWIDNAPYTWKTAVDADAASIPRPAPISGTVTVPGMKEGWYKVEWWDTSTGTVTTTETKKAEDSGDLVLAVNSLVSDTAVKIYSTETPSVIIPPPTPSSPTTATPPTPTPTQGTTTTGGGGTTTTTTTPNKITVTAQKVTKTAQKVTKKIKDKAKKTKQKAKDKTNKIFNKIKDILKNIIQKIKK